MTTQRDPLPMSALGQKRTSTSAWAMSALPPKRTWISTLVMSAFPATRCFYRIIATVSPREVSMKRPAAIATGAALLLACAFAVQAQEKISDGVVKIGMLEDMASIYADITGVGAVTAAKMAVEDFGGKVLGKPIEVVAADHQNKPDIASATAREWFNVQHVDALMDVAASATALAVIELAKTNGKIVVLNGPGATRITNEACTPVSIHYTYDNYAISHGAGAAVVKAGYDTWFFLTADYAFGHDLEQVTTRG